MKSAKQSGTLFVVATPIGNLEDISKRASRILSEVDLIACEDTRHTRKLLNHLDISTALTSYYREKEQYKAEILIQKLLSGTSIALVSDAGTPAISDPGSILVQSARKADISIIPIPGASAITTALSVSGINETAFFFGGFLPAKKGLRKNLLQQLSTMTCPLVFYESPHRIKKCLEDCHSIFNSRPILLFRELTKIYEEHLVGTATEILEKLPHKIKGELVLIIHQADEIKQDKPDNLEDLLHWYKEHGKMSLKDAVSNISQDLDLSRSLVYKKALSIWKKK